jgi:hypothetical protein
MGRHGPHARAYEFHHFCIGRTQCYSCREVGNTLWPGQWARRECRLPGESLWAWAILTQQFRCNFVNLDFFFQLPKEFIRRGQLDAFRRRLPRPLASINLILANPVVKSCGADSPLVRGSGEWFARAHKGAST